MFNTLGVKRFSPGIILDYGQYISDLCKSKDVFNLFQR
jgi:hypothetical protein